MESISYNNGYKLNKIGYSLKDVTVVQAPIGKYLHRGDVNTFTNICNREVYPIFVSPMTSVTDETNYKEWIKHKLTPVVPRSVRQNLNFKERMKIAEETFVSISLQEAEEELLKMEIKEDQKKNIYMYRYCKRKFTKFISNLQKIKKII